MGRPSGSRDEPLLLVTTRGQQQLVAACCEQSAAAGVTPGLTLAHARALVGVAIVEPFDPGADARSLRRLAEWATRYSPIAAPCSEGAAHGLLLDITGCQRLFRGEDRLARLLHYDLTRLGLHARIGLGTTIGAAWAAAWFGPSGTGVPAMLDRSGIEALPVAALRLEEPVLEGLAELGVERIGQLLALPRRQLPSRFGPDLVRRIDQLFGEAIETVEPVRPDPPLRLERLFDGPATQPEAIELATRELLAELCRALLRRESGVRRLEAAFERVSEGRGRPRVRRERLTLSAPSRDPRHLWSLLRPRVERLHMGFGVEGVSLVAVREGRLRHRQLTRDGTVERENDDGTHQLLDTLVNRLGEERVLRAQAVASHVPERAFRFAGAQDPPTARTPAHHPAPAGARPTVLLERPEPAEAVALRPDRPPTTLRWRAVQHRVTLGIGPERIGMEWWRSARAQEPDIRAVAPACLDVRDYYRVRLECGLWVWVYRALDTGAWFVHGLWS